MIPFFYARQIRCSRQHDMPPQMAHLACYFTETAGREFIATGVRWMQSVNKLSSIGIKVFGQKLHGRECSQLR